MILSSFRDVRLLSSVLWNLTSPISSRPTIRSLFPYLIPRTYPYFFFLLEHLYVLFNVPPLTPPQVHRLGFFDSFLYPARFSACFDDCSHFLIGRSESLFGSVSDSAWVVSNVFSSHELTRDFHANCLPTEKTAPTSCPRPPNERLFPFRSRPDRQYRLCFFSFSFPFMLLSMVALFIFSKLESLRRGGFFGEDSYVALKSHFAIFISLFSSWWRDNALHMETLGFPFR